MCCVYCIIYINVVVLFNAFFVINVQNLELCLMFVVFVFILRVNLNQNLNIFVKKDSI